ncbi:hypothetical protein [Vibrio sp. TRT 17S01]|uniref:hypothetical protein n=1 Tax=Vibrio sp. TRT 17S01 TaxID=3418505 RepID=UPI003CF7839D
MKLLIKIILVGIGRLILFSLAVIFILNPLMKWYYDSKPLIGSDKDDHFIRIQGSKPADANVTAYATFTGGGEECRSRSWSALDGKVKKAGKGVFKIEYDFSTTPEQYELRVPYQDYTSSGCDMKLLQIYVGAKSSFNTARFPDLRIYSPVMDYDKALAFESIIEAGNCEPFYSKTYKKWTDGVGCDFYINKKRISEEQEFNAETVYFDFSQFKDDTTITYNILAGDNYRSEAVNP